jgi:hypothetical protein
MKDFFYAVIAFFIATYALDFYAFNGAYYDALFAVARKILPIA